METSTPRYVLITGSSTGIGKACAIHLAKSGFTSLAAVRREEDGKTLQAIAGQNLIPIQLDIAEANSISAAAQKIADITGDSGLAGLVNNAGIGVHGPLEFLPMDGWRKQFEVNVFGHVAVTQAMLPLIRKHIAGSGKGSGRIIFIGSIGGRVPLPILGPYTATKHAIAAIAASLRMELSDQGICVCLIEPGAIQSEIWRKGDEGASAIPANDPARQLYAKYIDAIIATSRQSAAGAIPADHVARLVYTCLTSPNPPRRRTVGRDAFFAAAMKRMLPESWFDFVLRKSLKIG